MDPEEKTMTNKRFEFLAAKNNFNVPSDARDRYAKFYDRSRFHRDRDRILHSRSFLRLKGKSQVFLAGYDDHVRNRLTHTLEVSQLATSLAISLGLNPMLTEAIALGHDLGHTPFGHVGERVLNDIMNGETCAEDEFKIKLKPEDKGFKHNWQSVHTVESLETSYRVYQGLDLSNDIKWGILNHSSLQFSDGTGSDFYEQRYNSRDFKSSWTFEALIMAFADEIAQRHHDAEDGLVAGLIDRNELLIEFQNTFNDFLKDFPPNDDYNSDLQKENHKDYFVPLFTKYVTHFYLMKGSELLRKNIQYLCKKFKLENSEDFTRHKSEIAKEVTGEELALLKPIDDSKSFIEQDKQFKNFLSHRILNSYEAQQMDGRSQYRAMVKFGV